MIATLEPMLPDDCEPVIDIYNYYIENSFAAYAEKRVPYEFFDPFLGAHAGYPSLTARDGNGRIVGFGRLRPYNQNPAFSRTCEVSYFVAPGFTGKGVGKMLLNRLVAEGGSMGITNILAGISSLNEGSLRFHLRNGFRECGRFQGIGRKNGLTFDVIYCQLPLGHSAINRKTRTE